ncbi:hypothetical protein BJX68DRAFT_272519 [Aspergillus pseudodeflectus]|uniref:Glycoside hydrolase family 3 C-terminal domain-containing protein n=1 Tax=Aspergillus pseudodeflectus TaxID=176178 RepID=A0ABR4JEU4_9EURO
MSTQTVSSWIGEPGFEISYFNSGSDVPMFTEELKVPVVAMVRGLKPGVEELGFQFRRKTSSSSLRILTPGPNDYEPTPHGAVLCYEEYVVERIYMPEAVQTASSSNVSIIFAGRNSEYESEGFELDTNSLPEAQVKLIKAVAAGSEKTILALNCGNPIDVSPF